MPAHPKTSAAASFELPYDPLERAELAAAEAEAESLRECSLGQEQGAYVLWLRAQTYALLAVVPRRRDISRLLNAHVDTDSPETVEQTEVPR